MVLYFACHFVLYTCVVLYIPGSSRSSDDDDQHITSDLACVSFYSKGGQLYVGWPSGCRSACQKRPVAISTAVALTCFPFVLDTCDTHFWLQGCASSWLQATGHVVIKLCCLSF